EGVVHWQHMLAALIERGIEQRSLGVLRDERDFATLMRGSLILFRAHLRLSDTRFTEREGKLEGSIGRKPVEVHFSFDRITVSGNPLALFGQSGEWEGLAVVMSEPTAPVAILVPLAFGLGFLDDEKLPRT